MSASNETIKEDCTDAELSAAVAEHVAKLPNMHWIDHVHVYGGEYPNVRSVPHFATSADAVLPLLGDDWEANANGAHEDSPRDVVVTFYGKTKVQYAFAGAPTFARAACFALLKAHGFTITES